MAIPIPTNPPLLPTTMLLFVVLQFFLAILAMLFTIGNPGSVAPLMANIITIDAPAVPLLTSDIDAFAWIHPMLSGLHALTKFSIRTLDAFPFNWAQLAVVHSSLFTLIPHLSGLKGGKLPAAENHPPANLKIIPHARRYAVKGVSYVSHPASLVWGSSVNSRNALALSPLPSNIANGGRMYSALLLGLGRQPSNTRTFSPLPPRSWWTDVIHCLGLLCALLVALLLDISTQRMRANLEHKHQSGQANAHNSASASLMLDFIGALTVHPQTALRKSNACIDTNICTEDGATYTTQTALVGSDRPIRTPDEADDIQAEAMPKKLIDVGQKNALAQVLIILTMVMVSMECEFVDKPFQPIVTARETKETIDWQTIVVKPDSLNWNESPSSAYLMSMTASKGSDCDKERWENTFGSFEEDFRPFSPTVDMLAQERGRVHTLDHSASVTQDFSSESNLTVVEGQGENSVSDIEDILREFSSKTGFASDASVEDLVSNCGGGLEKCLSPNLLQDTPHSELFTPHEDEVDEGKHVHAFCTMNTFQQWLDHPQGLMGEFGSLPVAQETGEQIADSFDDFLRHLSSSGNVAIEGSSKDPAFSIENIAQYTFPSFLEQIRDLGQVPVPGAEHGHQAVPDFSSWFESAQNQKLLDDLAAEFPFSLDGPDLNLEAALADLVPFVPLDDVQLPECLGSIPEPGLENFTFPVDGANWCLGLPMADVTQPEPSFTPPSDVGHRHPYFADYDHFTTDELFAPESTVIVVSLNSAAPSHVHVAPDAEHSAPAVPESLVHANISFTDPDVSSSSTLVHLDEEVHVESIKAPPEDSASITKISDPYAPVPVVNFRDDLSPTSEPVESSINCGLSASIHVPRPASNSMPIVDVSAVLEREHTCHYVIPSVETYEEVKAKFDLYDLFVALATQKGEVQGVSASMHAVKELALEGVGSANAALSVVKRERVGQVSMDVPAIPMEKERQIPAVAQDVSKPVKLSNAIVNTPDRLPVAPSAPPSAPLKEREIRKDSSIYASMWASRPTEPIVARPTTRPRKENSAPKVSRTPFEGRHRPKDRSINASFWASCQTEHQAPQPTIQKRVNTFVPKVTKPTQDRSIYGSIYADRPKPVSPKSNTSFRFSSTRAEGQHGKNPTFGWTKEELEGAQLLLGLSGRR